MLLNAPNESEAIKGIHRLLTENAEPAANPAEAAARTYGLISEAIDKLGVVVTVHADGTKSVYPPSADTDAARGAALALAVAAAVSGETVTLAPATFEAATVTVPTGVTLIGAGTNTTIVGNLVLNGTANARGIVIADGYYVQQDGVKYYA